MKRKRKRTNAQRLLHVNAVPLDGDIDDAPLVDFPGIRNFTLEMANLAGNGHLTSIGNTLQFPEIRAWAQDQLMGTNHIILKRPAVVKYFGFICGHIGGQVKFALYDEKSPGVPGSLICYTSPTNTYHGKMRIRAILTDEKYKRGIPPGRYWLMENSNYTINLHCQNSLPQDRPEMDDNSAEYKQSYAAQCAMFGAHVPATGHPLFRYIAYMFNNIFPPQAPVMTPQVVCQSYGFVSYETNTYLMTTEYDEYCFQPQFVSSPPIFHDGNNRLAASDPKFLRSMKKIASNPQTADLKFLTGQNEFPFKSLQLSRQQSDDVDEKTERNPRSPPKTVLDSLVKEAEHTSAYVSVTSEDLMPPGQVPSPEQQIRLSPSLPPLPQVVVDVKPKEEGKEEKELKDEETESNDEDLVVPEAVEYLWQTETNEFLAHKCVILARCPKLLEIQLKQDPTSHLDFLPSDPNFGDEMKASEDVFEIKEEKEEKDFTEIVEIQKISKDEFSLILEYIYTEGATRLVSIHVDTLLKLIVTCDQLGLAGLTDYCLEALKYIMFKNKYMYETTHTWSLGNPGWIFKNAVDKGLDSVQALLIDMFKNDDTLLSSEMILQVLRTLPSDILVELMRKPKKTQDGKVWQNLKDELVERFTKRENGQEEIKLFTDFSRLFDERAEDTTDFSIRIGKEMIYAHKAILDANSDFFSGLFRSQMIDRHSMEITQDPLPSIDAILALLRYLYSGILEISLENVHEVMENAKFYQVDSDFLEATCADLLDKNYSYTEYPHFVQLYWKSANSRRKRGLKLTEKEIKEEDNVDILKSSPPEILDRICFFLDPKSLCYLNNVDSSLYCASIKSDLWHGKLRELDPTIQINDYVRNFKTFYLNSHKSLLQKAAEEKARQEQYDRDAKERVRRQEIQEDRRFYSGCLHFYQEIILRMCTSVLVTIFLIVLIIDLTNNDTVSWLSASCLIVLAVLYLTGFCCLYYVAWQKPPIPFQDTTFSDANGCIVTGMSALGNVSPGYHKPQHRWCGCLLFLVLWSAVFLSIRITTAVSWNYAIVFLPVWLLSCCCCGVVGFDFPIDYQSPYFRFRKNVKWIIGFSFIPFVLFFIFVVLRVETARPIPVAVVFLPFYFLWIALAIWNCCENEPSYQLSDCMLYCCVWVLTVGCGFAFQLLLILKVDAGLDIAYYQVFIPLGIPLLLLWCYTVIASYKSTNNFNCESMC